AIRFDETADWPRCQRMLADEGFVNVVLSFDPRRLDDAPFVPLHVASQYLGMGSAAQPPAAAGDKGPQTSASERWSSLRKNSNLASIKPALDVASVTRASAPCGPLLRWIQELVIEHVERTKLQAKLIASKLQLVSAE
ncbi:unnamed protein product, partial [Polarella glacialis]